jgi:hypothetical protein
MTTTFMRLPLVFLVLAGALALATPSVAEMVNFKADLKAASEVPPNDSKGSGSVTATYDTVGKKLSYKGSYSGFYACHMVRELRANGGYDDPRLVVTVKNEMSQIVLSIPFLPACA